MGCTGNSHETALLFGGDDLALPRASSRRLAGGDPLEWVAAARPRTSRRRRRQLAASATAVVSARPGGSRRATRGASACEVSTTLARRLGLPAEVQAGLDQVYERWDGHGPGGVGGEALCVPRASSHVVDVVEIADRAAAWRRRASSSAGARAATSTRRSPACSTAAPSELLAGLDDVDVMQAALDAEPTPQPRCERSELEGLARRSRTSPTSSRRGRSATRRRSRSWPRRGRARRRSRETLLLAGLLHDLGRVAVPNGIWDKPKRSWRAQWERVRLHTYYTERILSRTPVFAGLARASPARTTSDSTARAITAACGERRAVGADARCSPSPTRTSR